MAAARILVVEDEEPVREMVRFTLCVDGFNVDEAADVNEAEQKIAREHPNLILLDCMLPGVSGISFARNLRRRVDTKEIPIIMLTARVEEEDKLLAFESGVDDYVTKPFSPRELLARVKANLRRTSPHYSDDPVEVEGLVLDPTSHRVLAQGKNVDIGPTEFRLLHFFATHQERVYSRAQLLDNVWGLSVYVEERTVDVHIRRLRQALAPFEYDGFIQTIWGSGYRFSPRL